MRIPLIALGLVLLVGACAGSGDASGVESPPVPTPVTSTAVTLRDNSFDPRAITVTAGAEVTFTNTDGIAHDVTFTSGDIASTDAFSSGSRTVVLPTAPGTYTYHCTMHPKMQGTVTVQ